MRPNYNITADLLIQHLEKNGWSISYELLTSLPDSELNNLYLELGSHNRKLNSFVERIKFHNFGCGDSALDFGCGYGQWSIAFSKYFDQIYAVDKSQLRLDIAKSLSANTYDAHNIHYAASLDVLHVRT